MSMIPKLRARYSMTFSARAFFILAALNVTVLCISILLGIRSLQEVNREELEEHTQIAAEFLAVTVKPFLMKRDYGTLTLVFLEFMGKTDFKYGRVFDRDGKIVIQTDQAANLTRLGQERGEEELILVSSNIADGASYFGKVEMGVSNTTQDSLSYKMFQDYVAVVLTGAGISLFLTYLIMRRMTAKLRAMLSNVNEVIEGKSLVRIPDDGGDEISKTARSFNALSGMLFAKRQEFDLVSAAALDCIVLLDEVGNITHFNLHAQQTFGYTTKEVLGKPMVEMLIPVNMRKAQEARLKNFLATGDHKLLGERVRLVAQRANGSQFPAEMVISATEANDKVVFVVYLRDRTEIQDVEARLDDLAYKDDVTGLPNRVLLRDRLKQAMIEADARDRLVAVVLLDLDRFKNINDSLGHEKGDKLIQEVATRLRSTVRRGDTIARLGGDEFALVMADIAEAEDVHLVAQKIIDRVAEPIYIDNIELYVSVSIGITFYPADDIEVDDLLKNADAAMYRAKSMGGGCYQYYSSEMSSSVQNRLELESALRHALDRNELMLYYQPQVDLHTGKVYGMEALIRWYHPTKGLIDPQKFIPLAEETSLISSIGEWVLQRACEQNLKFLAKGFPPLRVSVNVSTRQFADADFVGIVKRVLKKTGHSPSLLDIEITESMLTEDTEDVIRKLSALSKLGIKISLDDFGTGYSSLSYLKRLPIDTLKIDRSFVRDLATDPDDASIIRAILNMAKSLGLDTVAEGVEDEPQLEFLAREGCDRIQGYYFSKPLAFKEFALFLREGKRFSIPGKTKKIQGGRLA